MMTLTWGPSVSVDSNYDELVLLATSLEVLDDDVAGILVGSDNLGVGEMEAQSSVNSGSPVSLLKWSRWNFLGA